MAPETEKKEKRMETRMSAIESGIQEIKEQLATIMKKIGKTEAREKEQFERIIKIENLCTDCLAMRREIDEIKVENINLKNKINTLEKKARIEEKNKIRNSIEIYGIPKRENEEPKEIIIALARSAKVELTKDDFEESYRLKSRDGRDRQLIAKFKLREKKS